MKKIIISLAVVFAVSLSVTAQRNAEVTNKQGIAILPSAGDVALGIEADPFLEYLGDMIGLTGVVSPGFNSFLNNGITLYGKYFLTDESAVRVKLGFNFGSNTLGHAVLNETAVASNPLDDQKSVIDYKFDKKREVALSIGYEMRRGYHRLQGFFGGELGLGYTNNFASYQYGNPMALANQSPETYDFELGVSGAKANRAIENKAGMRFKAGINAFVGAEYFFAPKMSIGGELGLGFFVNNQSMGANTTESFNPVSGQVETKSTRIGKDNASSFFFNTVPAGNLFLAFHF